DDWLSGSADAGGVVRAAAPEAPGAKRAVTRYQAGHAAGLPGGAVWLRLWPETGRTHQLRAQATLRGHPVWGDTRYGSARPFAPGIALHARTLTFRHPALARELTISAPLPAGWAIRGFDLTASGPSP
ncbi:MAG: RluA family pseudouridine synthase, partial [Planctomycetia bacterium]|nr:RluA family pseudouridine synthase [Planctomycetia bacterium]